MTSLRFEDLKEELNQLKDRICIKLKQGISKLEQWLNYSNDQSNILIFMFS